MNGTNNLHNFQCLELEHKNKNSKFVWCKRKTVRSELQTQEWVSCSNFHVNGRLEHLRSTSQRRSVRVRVLLDGRPIEQISERFSLAPTASNVRICALFRLHRKWKSDKIEKGSRKKRCGSWGQDRDHREVTGGNRSEALQLKLRIHPKP